MNTKYDWKAGWKDRHKQMQASVLTKICTSNKKYLSRKLNYDNKKHKSKWRRQPNILYSAFYHLIYISAQLCWYLFFILAFHYFIFLKWGCHSLFHVEYLWSCFSFLDKYFLFLYSLIKSLVETFTCTCVWLCPFVEFHSQFPVHSRLVL